MSNFKPVIALVAGAAFALSPAARAATQNEPFYYVIEAEALGGYSEIPGHQGTASSIDDWLVSPTVKFNEDLFWINIYNGSFNRSAQVVAQDEGGRLTDTTQTHSLSSALKWNVTPSWSLRPLAFADWVFINETEDEDFGEGLYDYRELGGGIESSWTILDAEDAKSEVRAGFRFLNRQYPNYQSLLSLFDPNGSLETNEKDLDGYKWNLAYDSRVKDGWSWGAEGIFFYKDYTDKRTIDLNGIRSATDTRRDTVEYANVYISRPLSKVWLFRVDGQATANQSNLDFYDTHNTLTLSDDDFIKDYFEYFSFMAKPSLTYVQSLGEDKNLIVSADYSFYALLYPDRKTQDVSGVYQAEEERDYRHTLSARTSFPITKNWSWVVFGSYVFADSNQDFETYYLYNYDLWTAVTGISFKS